MTTCRTSERVSEYLCRKSLELVVPQILVALAYALKAALGGQSIITDSNQQQCSCIYLACYSLTYGVSLGKISLTSLLWNLSKEGIHVIDHVIESPFHSDTSLISSKVTGRVTEHWAN